MEACNFTTESRIFEYLMRIDLNYIRCANNAVVAVVVVALGLALLVVATFITFIPNIYKYIYQINIYTYQHTYMSSICK